MGAVAATTTGGGRATVAAALLVLLVYAVGWTGFLSAGEVGIRGGGPSPDVPGARAITGVVPGSAADRAGLRAGDVVVALGGVPADDPAYDRATVATRAGHPVTLRVRRVLAGGGHGPEEDVAVTADPVLAPSDKRAAAARDAAAGAVLLLFGAVAHLRWPRRPGTRLVLIGVAAVAIAFGLRAWNVAFPDGVAVWRTVGGSLTAAGLGAAILGATAAARGHRARDRVRRVRLDGPALLRVHDVVPPVGGGSRLPHS